MILEKHKYQYIIEQGKKEEDIGNRQKITEFIETYRTAYNKKDLIYIEKVFSDDALIIVGRVLQETDKNEEDWFKFSKLGEQKIKFLLRTKIQYIEKLRDVFKINSFIKIYFDNIEIIRHPMYKEIYGVTLKQRWNSSNYSDEGTFS